MPDRPGPRHSTTPTSRYVDVLRSRWALVSVATLVYWTGAHALRPLLPLRLDALGASEVVIGVVVALFPLSSLGLAIPGGRLVDRVGIRRVVFAGLAGMGLLGLGFAVTASVPLLALLTAGIGLAELATWICLQALASVGGGGAFLTRQLALFSLAWGGGIALGPIVGSALYDRIGFVAVGGFYLACALVAAGCLLFAPRVEIVPRGSAPGSIRRGVATMWASSPVRATLLSSFVTLFIHGVRGSFLPLYLQRAGLPVPRIGVVLSVLGIASLVVRLPLPSVRRRVGTLALLLASMWFSLLPMTLVPFVDGFGPWLALAALTGVGLGINPPITVELMAQHTDAAQRGLAMGLRLTANRVAQVVQPLLFGGLVATAGFTSAFAVAGTFLAGVTAWTHRLRLS